MQRIAVYGYIRNNEGKILLVQRAPHDSFPGLWEMPGGTLDFGEDPKIGVEREVQEECGISVEALHPIAAISGVSEKNDSKSHTVRLAFLCRLIDKRSKITLSKEHSAYLWVDPTNLPLENISKLFQQAILQQME